MYEIFISIYQKHFEELNTQLILEGLYNVAYEQPIKETPDNTGETYSEASDEPILLSVYIDNTNEANCETLVNVIKKRLNNKILSISYKPVS